MEFPIEFPKCPKCGSSDTVCQQACQNEPSIPKGTFVSLEKRLTRSKTLARCPCPLARFSCAITIPAPSVDLTAAPGWKRRPCPQTLSWG